MKTNKLFKIVTLLSIPVIFYFVFQGFASNTGIKSDMAKMQPAPNNGKNFENVIFNYNVNALTPEQYIPAQISRYKGELNFTGVQTYDFGNDTYGWFNETLSSQHIENIEDLSSDVSSHSMDFYFHRPKIAFLCYGQRLVYEVANGNNHTDVNDGFCYQTCGGSFMTEQDGRTVLHASDPAQQYPAGYWLAKNIYENRAHGTFVDFGHGSEGTWYVKPVMRIDSSVVDNFPEKEVVRIDVYNYNNNNGAGTPIKSVTIKARNFAHKNLSTGEYIYNGTYKDIYEFIEEPSGTNLEVIGGNWKPHDPPYLNTGDPGWLSSTAVCYVDFKVYWLGQVECWFDKTTVDNEVANRLFKTDTSQNYDSYIEDELSNTSGNGFTYFVDEIAYSDVPCIKYVQDKIDDYNTVHSTNIKLSCAINNWWNLRMTRNETLFNKTFLDVVKPTSIEVNIVDKFGEFPGCLPEGVFEDYDYRIPDEGPDSWFGSKQNYTEYVQKAVFGDRNSRTPVNEWLQSSNRELLPPPMGSCIYDIEKAHEQIGDFSSNTKLIVQGQLQAHTPVVGDDPKHFAYFTREPLNEEIEAQVGVIVSHGAESLFWFIYQSREWPWEGWDASNNLRTGFYNPINNISSQDSFVDIGLLDINSPDRRILNCYNQPKWDFISAMNLKILKWKPVLENTNWQNGWSVHSEGANHNFITDIKSIDPSRTGYNGECYGDGLTWEDCQDERYWEMGFYNPIITRDLSKYVMFVNRRTIPVTNLYTGDNRVLKIKFNGSNLPGFNNWTISEVGNTNLAPVQFNKNSTSYIDLGSTNGGLGWFKPGEAKLYKLVPVMQSGGELVTDEIINGLDFDCLDTVYNDGYNITFKGNGNTVIFSDSATIIMDGGTFQTDSASHGPQTNKNLFKAVSGHTWNGLQLSNCNVKIYNSKFENIASPEGGSFAVNTVDCYLNDIRWNTFISSTDTAGGLRITYLNNSEVAGQNAYVMYNTFTMNGSFSSGIQVQGFAGLTAGVYITGNQMTSNGNATGIFLSTITNAVIKKNSISGFSIGVNTLLSSADMFGNTISNTSALSKGILAGELSSINLAPDNTSSTPYWTGGFNSIVNTYGSSVNLEIDNSDFNVWGGYNTLDADESSSAYHLSGYYWDGSYIVKIENNCYKENGTAISSPDAPFINVSDYYTNPVTYNYTPYLCGGSMPTGTDIVDIGGGLYDTIATGSGGSGGSYSSAYKPATANAKQLYDSIKINIRRRNFSSVKTLCINLLNTYPDSAQSISSLQILYNASVFTDTSSAAINELKTIYENLILNHGNNGALVKISGYLVLKCKVLLRQYTNALSGFEQIINNSPYSYEGLLARWDYMATSLFIQGQSGGQSAVTLSGVEGQEDNDDDKNPLTKEQRKVIKETVIRTLETSRDKEQKNLDELTKQAKEGNENSRQKLQKKMALKDIIKTERPKNIFEHLKIVNNDIQRVYQNPNAGLTKNQNLIPVTFSLSQNYPNPFNPVTLINYQLPNNSKVVLKIYDLLGREVKTLVNEFKQAGYYKVEFDGINFASGVYFYRIEAGDFVQSKKMVLIK